MATFSETRAVTLSKGIVKQGIKISKNEKNINYFGRHFSIFDLKVALKMLIFEGFFTSKMMNSDYSQ